MYVRGFCRRAPHVLLGGLSRAELGQRIGSGRCAITSCGRYRRLLQQAQHGHEPARLHPLEPPRDPSLGEAPLSLTKAVLRGVRVGIAEDEEVRFRVEPEEQGGAPALLVEPPERLEDAPLTRRMLEGRQFPFLRLLSIGLASKALRVTQDGPA